MCQHHKGGKMPDILTLFLIIVAVVVLLVLLSGIRFIPNNRIGIIEKRFEGKGSVKSGLIALNGEAGYQPRILRGGLHYLMPIQYVVHMMPLVTISQGKVGYVFARDGKQLDPAQVLASNATVTDFQDVEGFSEERRTARSAAPYLA
jgi:uncharacterized membrane protein YqiK